MGVEEERKFDVDPSYAPPELAGCLPTGGRVVAREPVILTASYYDTADLRLARAGGSLRFRDGDGDGDPQPWTVKLPTAVPGIRHEISRPGPPDGPPPAELVALVTALTRGAPLAPVVTVRSRRRRYELCDADGTVLAELADDTVSVLDGAEPRGGFRELEVERVADRGDLLDRVAGVLTGTGAVAGGFTPKHVRALTLVPSRRATIAAPPDLPPPEPPCPQPTGGDVLRQAIRRAAARIVAHDPLVRLGQDLPGGDTPVHQLRVGLRRLRSDLRTFEPLVDRQWAGSLRRKLRWLAGRLGAVRDVEVLRARLRRTATDPAPPVDPEAVARIDAALAVREHAARTAMDRALGSDRYVALLDALVAAARQPRLTPLASASAQQVLPGLVAGPWWALRSGPTGEPGAGDLAADAPDEPWHAVRVRGKRARYAVEAVADAVGGSAPALARKLAAVQDLLGEHQDAAVAGQTWLAIAAADPGDHRLAVATGQLYERERAAVRRVRAAFPAAWRAADRPKLQSWLS
ncbi:MAG: CHAD domain-containing protein [Micromonosporaceae bacterium]|nr:CHAD domain-containing protein [Micromonosporaceae bacterium]